MSETGHTKGPWSLFVGDDGKTIQVDIAPRPTGKRPCIVFWTGFDACDLPIEEQIANARLIAAAPDLLEALRNVEAFFDGSENHNCSVHREVKDALSKATQP